MLMEQAKWFPIPQRRPVTAPERPLTGSPWFAPAPEPDRPDPRQSFFKRRLAPLLAAIVALLAKFKTVLLLLPKLKLLTTAGTMLVSIAAYSFVFGWTFAIGFVVLLLVQVVVGAELEAGVPLEITRLPRRGSGSLARSWAASAPRRASSYGT